MTRSQLLNYAPKSEDDLQSACHLYMNHNYLHYHGLYFSVPNGGFRTKSEAARLKATGMTAGIPDYMLMVPEGSPCTYPAGWIVPIEFKYEKGDLNDAQKRIHPMWEKNGNKPHIIRSAAEFLDLVDTIYQK